MSTLDKAESVSALRNVISYSGVQQPCSNPSKSPEMLGKASSQKYLYLQAFCNLQKPPANYHAAFTRQRSLVRTQHRPLRKCRVLQVIRQHERKIRSYPLPSTKPVVHQRVLA